MYRNDLLFVEKLLLNAETYAAYLLNKLITYLMYEIAYVHHQQLSVLHKILTNNLH